MSEWVVIGTAWHTVPVNDLREHEASADCWCEPEKEADIDPGLPGLWRHNSADGRERPQ